MPLASPTAGLVSVWLTGPAVVQVLVGPVAPHQQFTGSASLHHLHRPGAFTCLRDSKVLARFLCYVEADASAAHAALFLASPLARACRRPGRRAVLPWASREGDVRP